MNDYVMLCNGVCFFVLVCVFVHGTICYPGVIALCFMSV